MTIDKVLFMQNVVYPAQMVRLLIAEMYDEGVIDRTAFKVTQRAAGANFTVDVAVGEAVVQGDDQTRQGNYLCRCTATENLALTAAPGSNSRYDVIILQIKDPNAGGAAGDIAVIDKVTGTTAATPAVPAIPNSALALAVIGPITSGTASITNSLIHDAYSGTGPTAALTTRMIAGRKCKPGTLELHAAFSDAINGWLACTGQAVSRSIYARLFAEIGTRYGAGDGTTTFNVPDLRNRVPLPVGTSYATIGNTGGEIEHTLTVAEMPSHTHTVPALVAGGGGGGVNAATISGTTPTTATGGDAPHNNMPPFQVVAGWAIRT